MTRANTPVSASFRRFLPFSPWLAPASLRLKKQKPLEYPSLAGAGSFAGAEMCPDKERPAENTAVLSRDLTQYGRISARQNRVCPCQPMVPSIDMGKYACQRAFSALFALFGLAGVSPPASQKAKITRKSIADRCTAVCPEQKCVQTRKGLQVILAVLPKGLTRYGRISARQNRVCPCQSMVSAENGHKMLHFGEQEQRYDPFDRRRKGV